MNVKNTDQRENNSSSIVVILEMNDKAAKIWGLTPTERLQRVIPKIGNHQIIILAPDQPVSEIKNKIHKEQSVALLRGDIVYDKPILQGLLSTQEDTVIIDEDGLRTAAVIKTGDLEAASQWLQQKTGPMPKATEKTPQNIGGSYHAMLRKREAPYCLEVRDDKIKQIEEKVFMGAYKGVTDIVTKYLWPKPAMVITRLCIKLGLSPNNVTWVGAALTLMAMYFFWHGQYGAGLVCGWIMTFLDTVDGKLARVTFTSSPFGNILDHGIDLIHPPFWYMAWAVGLAAYGLPLSETVYEAFIWAIFGSYIAGRIVEGYFMRRFGFHIHVWRRFDSFFRLILARRNPNMIILTISWLLMRPDIGLFLITLWHIVTFAVHIVQSVQAEIRHAQSRDVISWLDKPFTKLETA